MGSHPGNPHRRTEAVKIFSFMPHDHDIGRFLHQFLDRMRDYPRFDPRILFHHFGFAAIKLDFIVHIYGRLVTTASQRQVKTCLCLLPPLAHRRAIGGNPHAQRHWNPVAHP